MFASFLTTGLFAISAICGRQVSHHIRGTQANFIRLVLGAVLLGLWSHLFGFGVSGPAFGVLFISGCAGFGLGDLALFQTYPRLGARRSMVMVQCLAAPFGALIEWLWLGHAPTLAQAAFGAVILAGVAIALLPHEDADQPSRQLAVGIAFGTLAAFGQGLGAVISRKAYEISAAHGLPFRTLGDALNAAYQRMLGGIAVTVVVLIFIRFADNTTRARSDWSRGWPWLMANCIAGPTLGVTAYQWALISLPTNIVLPIVATTPLVVIPLAHFFEGDRITRHAVVGAIVAIAGVVGLTLAK